MTTTVSIRCHPDKPPALALYCDPRFTGYDGYVSLASRYGVRDTGPRGSYLASLPQAIRIAKNLRVLGFSVEWGAHTLQACASYEAAMVATRGAFNTRLREEGTALFPYQVRGADWLSLRSTGLLADEMGLGKTVQALFAIHSKAIIVCPGVAKGVWKREVERWRPDLYPRVIQGLTFDIIPRSDEVVILNYDILPHVEDTDYYFDGATGVDLIFDEAHALKNPAAKRTKLARALSEAVRLYLGRVWLLTATPMLNHGGELWEVLEAAGLAREAFGSWWTYCCAMGAYRSKIGKRTVRAWGNPTHEAKGLLSRVSLRRLRSEVLPQLPGKTHQDIPVSLTKKDLAAVEALLRDLEKVGWSVDRIISYLDKGRRPDGKIPFSLLTRLRNVLAMAKMAAMIEVVESYEEASEPLIVFSAHRPPIDLLAKRDGWLAITGDVTNERRSQYEARFQRGEGIRGIAGTIKAMGVSVTLTRGAHTLFVDHEWTPSINAQAEDRTSRIGQTRPCTIRHLVADHPVDLRVTEVLRRKTEAIGRIL